MSVWLGNRLFFTKRPDGRYRGGLMTDGGATFATGLSSNAVGGDPAAVMVRYVFGASTVDLWVNNVKTTFTLNAAPPTFQLPFDRLQLGNFALGSIWHVQIYQAPTGAGFEESDYLAQLAVGTRPLGPQTVRDRIASLADIAAIPAASLVLDPAARTPMPTAQVAGNKVADLMRLSANTDGGILFSDGAGRLVLHARTRRYNQPVDATISYRWLSQPLSWREDTPTNDVTVQRPAGPPGNAVNAASVAEFGTYPATVLVDTTCAPDLTNRAAWMTRTYAQPRVRCPQITLDLLDRTEAERALILARAIGDRIALTGVPAAWPAGASSLIIEGIRHVIDGDSHVVIWNTSPLLGTTPATPPACPAVGSATVGPSTTIQF
ncbi:hypothetical protein Lfu02_79740 [Longispora fulva]|uniref:Uncharacterized protein n=1 Tax=Longispora fulva TaxID=619741 RepID=A0A8J7GPX0_9ACTN|nr:hypothetical protein [Longispora fulva]MBG6141143.1 hypothetical protein [Longispora fulva]GIG63602.1 hypothetical protein Lfu02_79740 [Longispora fulva]